MLGMLNIKIFPFGLALFAVVWLPKTPQVRAQEEKLSLVGFKKAHQTQLVRKEKIGEPVAEPPKGVLNRVDYETQLGKMAAYVSPDPKDGKKHPLIIWRVGGFANSIGEFMWEEGEPDNDQSAAQYRKAGVLMMYPSLRGGNENPGYIEGCYGEVDDVLAAAEYAKKLPYVDPQQIYLGGHSVGGTLALLVAAMDKNPFKAVIAFGPVHSAIQYGEENMPINVEDKNEMVGRAPIVFLNSIETDTWVIEGKDGNIEALQLMEKHNQNRKVRFVELPGDHFGILAAANAVVAKRIMAAVADGKFELTAADFIPTKTKTGKEEKPDGSTQKPAPKAD